MAVANAVVAIVLHLSLPSLLLHVVLGSWNVLFVVVATDVVFVSTCLECSWNN